jgi:hypothetical protein
MKRAFILAAVIQVAAWAAQAAYVLSDNLGQPIAGATVVGQGQVTYEDAQTFMAVSAGTLGSITILGDNSDGANAVMELYQITSLSPFTFVPVGPLTPPSSWPAGPSLITWGGNNLALDAGSMYAAGLFVNGPGWTAWAYEPGSTGSGPGFLPYWAELDWSGYLNIGNTEPFLMQVEVPEPATWLAGVGAGLVALGTLGRRARK